MYVLANQLACILHVVSTKMSCSCLLISLVSLLYIYIAINSWMIVQDEVIPHQHGEQLAARCGGPVRTLYVDGAGHNDLELYPAFVDGITDFVLALASGSM